MMLCDVSVIVPNYNRTTLLLRALRSVVAQTLRPVEIIVVDDCSTDDKLSLIKSMVDEIGKTIPIRLLINDTNRGANHSRNRGIFGAKGKFLAFLDSDDLWMPEKLENQMAEIEQAKKLSNKPVLSATGRYRVNGEGDIIIRQFGGRALSPEKIRRSNFIGTLSSVVVEAWIARHIWGFNEMLPACQDWDFFIRLSDYVQYVGVANPLCIYVDHDEDRITLNNRKRLRAHIFIFRHHLRPLLKNTKTSSAEFYRNIAEDYQELGNPRQAAKYLAKSVAIASWKSKPFSQFAERFWTLYYRLRMPSSIKLKRYERYRRLMAQAMKDPKLRATVTAESVVIKRIMS